MSGIPYSYHTFLFPFIWKTTDDNDWEKFSKLLSVGKRWREISWGDEKIPSGRSRDEWCLDYNAFQYFTESANNAIFSTGITDDDNVVRCFEFCEFNDKNENGRYIIRKTVEVEKAVGKSDSEDGEGEESSEEIQTEYAENVYELDINRIRLNVYDAGVAILIFELENHLYESIDDVNVINERGRRINMPYLPAKFLYGICADSIELEFGGVSYSKEPFRESYENSFGETLNENYPINYAMSPIKKLLDNDGADNGGCMITFRDDGKGGFLIKPCIDDRMFVCCLVRDGKLSDDITKFDHSKGEYAYLSECFSRKKVSLSDRLYKLCYIEESLSCNSMSMKYDILKKSVYTRWIDYGTVHAVTHHSIVCVTGTDTDFLPSAVINPFLTEYVQMAILAVAQRSVLLMLSGEAAKVSKGFKDGQHITVEQISEIEKLQAKFIKVQNQLLLPEVTVQEQGVEIYDMIKEQLYISRNEYELDERMDNLRETTDISNSRLERKSDEEESKSINIIGIIFALCALSEPIAGFIMRYLKRSELCFYSIWTVITLILVLAAVIYFRRHGKSKKE